MAESYIYALVDPRSGNAFYVGVAQRPIRRFRDHVRPNNTKNQYLKARLAELADLNLRPKLRILETVEKHSRAERENYWIVWHLEQGIELCNIDVIYHKGKRLGIEAIRNRGKWAYLTAVVHQDHMKQIEEMADRQNRDKSEIVRYLLELALGNPFGRNDLATAIGSTAAEIAVFVEN